MNHSSPWVLGTEMTALETPALIVEEGRLKANLDRLRELAAGTRVRLRPHAKAHKSPVLARRQLAVGAIGVCCQKVSEAEPMVAAGIGDVLITNEVVDPAKLARIAQLAQRARIGLCVDSTRGIELAQQVASKSAPIDIYVEIDIGQGRCGTSPGLSALALAREVVDSSCLRFRGLQAFNGAAQHLRHHTERLHATAAASACISQTRTIIEEAGIPCEIVSGGGTGTVELDLAGGVYDEVQPGSYVFMDADYARNLNEHGSTKSHFEQSLFVYATVVSVRGTGSHAVLDAGLKAFSVDSGVPAVMDRTDLYISAVSDEHSKVQSRTGDVRLRVGDKLSLVPSHIDPTVNLHDYYLVVRNGVLVEIWPISARGPGL